MIYFYAFVVCGTICCIAQIIYDNTKLTPGHITSLFVVIGSFLDLFNLYDKLILLAGAGASLPITSFGHSLLHGALASTSEFGFLGITMGMLDLTSAGITSAILFSFLAALVFKPKS